MKADAEACGYCGNPPRGLASIGDTPYCHDGAGPTCYQRASWTASLAGPAVMPQLLSIWGTLAARDAAMDLEDSNFEDGRS